MEQTKRKPEPSAEKAEEGKKEDRRRLREILGVLARHNLAGGMTPEKLRSIVEDLGPTFVKLGQIMSMRRDMLPEAICWSTSPRFRLFRWALLIPCLTAMP